MMLTALLDRITGFLRAPARPHHSGDATNMVRPFPDRAAASAPISPITLSLLEALGVRQTPTFFLNGARLETLSAESLVADVRSAVESA